MPVSTKPLSPKRFDPADCSDVLKIERFGQTAVLTVMLPKFTDSAHPVKLIKVTDSLMEFARSEQPRHVVISFELVMGLTSEFIRSLLRLRAELAKHDGDIRVSCLTKNHREIFEIVDPCQVLFPLFGTVAEAWRSCQE